MLHYVRQGTGKSIVFVHGFLGSNEVFKSMIDDLSIHFDVIAIDLPGHGESPLEVEAYNVDTYAKAIEEVLYYENIQKAVWLGHSLGGYITLAALANGHMDIPKVILLHSAVNADDEKAFEKRTKQQQTIKQNGVEAFVEEIMPNFFAKASSPKLTEISKEIANKATIEGLVAALEVMKSRPNRQELIDTTTIPVLIIEGKHDEIVKPIETNNPSVSKVEVDSGHMGMLEDLDAVLQAIYNFLK